MISTLRRLPSRVGLHCRTVSQVADPAAWNTPPVQITTLSNGVRVATMQTHSQIAATGIFVDAGVRSEAAPGTAKFIEHLSKTCPNHAELDLMGAVYSAEVGREQSRFTINGGNPETAVGILSQVVSEAGLRNFASHRDHVLASLESTEASPRAVVHDNLTQCAFRDCGLSNTVVGPFDEAANISAEDIEDYLTANHTSDKTVVVATGPVNHADIVSSASAALEGLDLSEPEEAEKPYFCGAELLYRNDEMGPTAYVSIGYESVPWRSADAVTFMVMQHIIGSYKKDTGLVPGKISGNRTINNIANKQGVGCANEFSGFQTFYRDTGIFGFYAACDEVAVEHCVGELQFSVNVLSYSITDEEVARAKRELKTSLFGNNSALGHCGKIGQEVLALGRVVPAAEMVVRIDAIDAEEVKRVAYQYLNDAEVAVTGLGPLHGMPQYMDIRRANTMYRY